MRYPGPFVSPDRIPRSPSVRQEERYLQIGICFGLTRPVARGLGTDATCDHFCSVIVYHDRPA